MKVIYSYKEISNHGKSISDTFVRLARLSVELANRFYETELYCDLASKYFFEKNKIPFTRIILLDDIEYYHGSVFSYPKIVTMLHQEEPYIHIDFDTLIFNKLEHSNHIKFAYPEVKLSPTYDWKQIEYVYNSYILPFKKYSENNIEFHESILWNFNNIPNNSVVYVNNPYIIKNAYESILDFIGEDITTRDAIDGFAQYIEQFLLSQYLKNNKIKYGFFENVCNFSFHASKHTFQYRTRSVESLPNFNLLLNEDFIHFHNYVINEEIMLLVIEYIYKEVFNIDCTKFLYSHEF